MSTKKAENLTLQTIIVAALVIIVLIVLIVIFAGRMNTFGDGTDDCSSKNGVCVQSSNTGLPCGAGKVYLPTASCPDSKVCCVDI